MDLTPEQLDAALASGDPELLALVRRFMAATEHPLNSWQPRPDNVAEHDQQSAFVACDSRVQVCLGGTGSGKSDAAALKVAKFLLEQQAPPRKNTPFWVLSSTLDMSCGVLWGEKLSRFIPKEAIAHVAWLNAGMEHPRGVRLKPWPNGNNWLIEFKAEAQGRQKLQAASIGGAWISECLNDWAIFDEVLGRTRDYGWAKVFWDLCPLLPMVELEERYKRPPTGWAFFHQNTLCNQHLAPDWAEQYLAGLPEEIRETRCWGAFSSYEGCIYKELTADHVVEPFDIPEDWPRYRGLDFGNNFGCSWLAYDPSYDVWYVTHEYYREGGDLIANHAARIKDIPWVSGTTYGDPADPGSIRELNQHGVFVTGARKSVLEGIELVRKLLLAGRLKFFSTCQMTLQQHRAYRWEKQHGEKDAKPQPLKYWDHLCDSVRYVIYSRSLGMGDIPTQPLEIKPRERGLAAKPPDGGRVSSRSVSTLPTYRSRIPRRWG